MKGVKANMTDKRCKLSTEKTRKQAVISVLYSNKFIQARRVQD
jgi:hypothetical protein